MATRAAGPLLIPGLAALLAGCGSGHAADRRLPASSAAGSVPAALLREARPIGRGPRFHPPSRGPIVGPCRSWLGRRYGVHVELFAENRVVLLAAGIGVRGPVRWVAGRISAARCYGALATLEPTGVVLVRPGVRLMLRAVFRAWGEALSSRRAASFASPPGGTVRTYVGGRRWTAAPGSLPLTRHAEIVVEVGPAVPPHAAYAFPPGT